MWWGFEMGGTQLRVRHRLVHTVRAVFAQVRNWPLVLGKLLVGLKVGADQPSLKSALLLG